MDNFEETLRMASNGDMIAQYEIGAFYERQGNYDNAIVVRQIKRCTIHQIISGSVAIQ